MPAKRAKEIALAFPRGAHQEVFITGVLRYCDRARLQLVVHHVARVAGAVGARSARVARRRNHRGAQHAELKRHASSSSNVPVVNISGTLPKTPVPRVSLDNGMVGQLAAEHLIERGFETFAYFGLRDVAYSSVRQNAFDARLEAAGFASVSLLMPPTYRAKGLQWRDQQRKLVKWLAALPTPVGLFAVTDYRARQVLDACRQIGLRVPQQVAVIGVDNEEVICVHVQPQLTSVARDNQQEGYHAAAMLDQLIRGRKLESHRRNDSAAGRRGPRIDRDRGIQRSAAVRGDRVFELSTSRIRSACRSWRRTWAFRAAGWSTRSAMRSGESPYQYIRNRRLKLAQHLLETEPATKIYQVAQRTGFTSAKQLSMAFCQEFGQSPREYQRSRSK